MQNKKGRIRLAGSVQARPRPKRLKTIAGRGLAESIAKSTNRWIILVSLDFSRKRRRLDEI